MTADFLDVMAGGLTPAYARGLERLALPLTAGTDGVLEPQYDGLSAYRSRWGRDPEAPRHLLAPAHTCAEPTTVRVTFTRSTAPGTTQEHADVTFPAGWPGGDQLAVELPGTAAEFGPGLRITGLAPQPPAPTGPEDWQLTALLGTLARLLWTIGRDHQDLDRRAADVARQRFAQHARGAGLDLLGQDLGAPRFPPQRHEPDVHTLALLHLAGPAPVDASGHLDPARTTVTGNARPGRPGRFGPAFGFGPPGGAVTVTDLPDLTADFTVEAVVRPDRTVTGPGAVLARRDPPSSSGPPRGWSLALGTWRGIDHNLRFTVSDGTADTDLFADLDLADGRFHHLAATLRRSGPGADARLYLDGAEVNRVPIAKLGPLTSGQPLVIGTGHETAGGSTTDAPYLGLVEEVRISDLARTSFAPVTGESDEQYRDRLAIFQSWLLPTPDNLQDALNRLAGGGSDLLVVDETTAEIASGSAVLRVLPPRLTPGRRIAADGDPLPTEEQAVGTAADEPDFDPLWISAHRNALGLGFDGNDDNRLMQLTTRQALDALLARLAGLPEAQGGELTVLHAYDPAGPGLHAVGRALSLRHSTVPTAELGVHAHAAGFGWVSCGPDDRIHASQPPGDAFAISVTAGLPPVQGQSAALALDPPVSAATGAVVHWSVTRDGPGSADVSPGSPADTATLHATAAGDVTVGVEVTRAGHTRGGRLPLRIGLPEDLLTAGQSIGRDGRIGATEAEAAGTVTEDFDAAYLQVRTDDLGAEPAPVDYGSDPDNRRMQPAAGAALDRLLAGLGRTAPLTVVSAHQPTDPGLAGQGRVLVLRDDKPVTVGHPFPLTPAALAARAFAAGFDHIAVQAPATVGGRGSVRLAVAAGEQLTVTPSPPAAELTTETGIDVAVGPRAAPAAACFRPDGGRVFLADRGSHRIVAYDLSAPPGAMPRPAFAGAVRTGPLPVSLAFVGGRLFVAHERGRVVALDPGTLAATPLATPDAVALGTDGTRLYLTATDGTLRAYDPQSGTQLLDLPLPGPPGAVAAGSGPLLAVLLDGSRFCLVDRQAGTLHGGPVAVPDAARVLCAAYGPTDGRLYVGVDTGATGAGRGALQVYRPGAAVPDTTLTAFPPGTAPVAICPATDQRHLYVATAGLGGTGGRVHVLDTADGQWLPLPFAAGDDCRALAASPAAAPYPPCLLAAPEAGGALLLADQRPLGQSPPQPPQLTSRQTLGPDAGVRVAWSVLPFGPGRAEPVAFDAPVTAVTGLAPGLVRVRADCLRGSPVLPYQCEVRPADPQAVIGKGQYDLVLNVLNWFQPIGVEFLTGDLRAHVRELAGADADLLPAFTFPTYHTYDQLPFHRPERDDPP
ncbi:LamG-like jellyroll fold domain-containing protein [Kitasatospora sp. NPDC059795]|uniref:LamG-like jellyroll fold domain-containing protein n=1 Tax=Kitasatospora sp. NPDC059795 TaxID=3346949 RepID=UPI0036682A80